MSGRGAGLVADDLDLAVALALCPLALDEAVEAIGLGNDRDLGLGVLAGSAGDHIHGQVVVGVIITGVVAYFSVRYLVRYFETRTLTPFAIYCLIAGGASIVRFAG